MPGAIQGRSPRWVCGDRLRRQGPFPNTAIRHHRVNVTGKDLDRLLPVDFQRAFQPARNSITPNAGNAQKGTARSDHQDRERSNRDSVGSSGFTRQVVVEPNGCVSTNLRVPDSDSFVPTPTPILEDLWSSPFQA